MMEDQGVAATGAIIANVINNNSGCRLKESSNVDSLGLKDKLLGHFSSKPQWPIFTEFRERWS